jgi:hypothetical protein
MLPDLEVEQVPEVHLPLAVLQGAATLAVAQVVRECLTLAWILLCVEQQPHAPLLGCEEAVRMEQVPPGQIYLHAMPANFVEPHRIQL